MEPVTETPLLTFEKVFFRNIFSNLSFTVHRKDVFVLSGPSGSGKTSLLRLVNRLSEPDGGRILFEGRPVANWDVVELRRRAVMLMQKPVPLGNTVLENVSYGLRIHPESASRDMNEQVLRSLAMAGLDASFLKREFCRLSVGEQQRVCLARALALDAEVLLLDEPTASLDPEAARHVEETISDLNRNGGMTILLVTHDGNQAERLATNRLSLGEMKK